MQCQAPIPVRVLIKKTFNVAAIYTVKPHEYMNYTDLFIGSKSSEVLSKILLLP